MPYITNFTQSDNYRQKVHSLIPGGAHTYSKGDDQFPLLSPAAISHGLGAYVWDVDGNKYLDCPMGLTSVSLGHAYPSVIDRVKQELDRGVNFQRPASIELEMAETFLSLIPGHDMIKFAKNGSIATTAAVKLSRAYTKRQLVAFPSDHPFYSYDDWFIGTTACNEGVPEQITKLSLTYDSNNLESLKQLMDKYPGQIACVITEPVRFVGLPTPTYLQDLQSICHKNGTLLILDEMITGFKVDFPGAITKYGIVPDMATWGKGIANGFSFCALTGKKEIMELGGILREGEEKLFLVSTTHGGETTSIAACLATIKEFREKNVIEHNHSIGKALIAEATQTLKRCGLSDYVQIYDCPWMVAFTFKDRNRNSCNGMRTLMLQEMIKRGVLFQGTFVPCFSHTKDDVAFFCQAFTDSLEVYRDGLEHGYQRFLVGPPTKPVFRKKI